MDTTTEDRIAQLEEQLLDPTLTEQQVQTIDRKLKILRSGK